MSRQQRTMPVRMIVPKRQLKPQAPVLARNNLQALGHRMIANTRNNQQGMALNHLSVTRTAAPVATPRQFPSKISTPVQRTATPVKRSLPVRTVPSLEQDVSMTEEFKPTTLVKTSLEPQPRPMTAEEFEPTTMVVRKRIPKPAVQFESELLFARDSDLQDEKPKLIRASDWLSLNQVIRRRATLGAYADVQRTMLEIKELSSQLGFPPNDENAFVAAALYQRINSWQERKVLELGAQNNILSAYLAKKSEIHYIEVADLLSPDREQGEIDKWLSVWKDNANAGGKWVRGMAESAFRLSQPDGEFDVVIARGLLERVAGTSLDEKGEANGDLLAMAEINRVLKPGGIALFSVAVSETSSSGHISIPDLLSRILAMDGFVLLGQNDLDYDFSMNNPLNDAISFQPPIGRTSTALFALVKTNRNQ